MQALDNLVRIGQLKPEPADAKEFAGLLGSAKARLRDARHAQLVIESRFDLATKRPTRPGLAGRR